MTTGSVQVDCSALDDAELNSISEILTSNPAVEDVAISAPISTDVLAQDEALALQASADIFLLTVKFVAHHWGEITSGVSGTLGIVKAGQWLAKEINRHSQGPELPEEIVALYDQDSRVVSLVKRHRK